MRQLLAAIALSAAAIAGMAGAIGPAGAADLTGYQTEQHVVRGCAGPQETVVLFKEKGLFPRYLEPTVPARTPYFYCVTGTMLLPGDIPPPAEYCCS
jgi:hypothetical protein